MDNEKWKVNIFCRKKDEVGMTLFKDSVKEIKGQLRDNLYSNNKPKHHREFE